MHAVFLLAAQASMPNAASSSASSSAGALRSLYDMLLAGGPLMIPIGLCSVIALTYIVERSIRLRATRLGTSRAARELVAAVERGGPAAGLEACARRPSALARTLAPGLKRWDGPLLEREKAIEDAGAREAKRLAAPLRPLVVVGAIAPLLGLLGTVWGMIQAFSNIALKAGLGKPELLAAGISQALVTTAAGLAVAIPAQAAYFWYRARIDRAVRRAEDVYATLADLDLARRGAPARDAASAGEVAERAPARSAALQGGPA